MSMEFMRETLKRVVATIASSIGFHTSNDSCLNVLSDILHEYLMNMGKRLKFTVEICGRTEPNFGDLIFLFKNDDNIDFNSLLEYINCVNIPLNDPPLPILPIQRPNCDVIQPKSIVPLKSNQESGPSMLTELSQESMNFFPGNFKIPKHRPKIPIKIDFRDDQQRKNIIQTVNVNNHRQLTEQQMYIFRKCIELENRLQKVQFLLPTADTVNVLKNYINYQTKVLKYYNSQAKQISRKPQKLSESRLENDKILVYNDILTQDIDLGLSVTVETSNEVQTKKKMPPRCRMLNSKKVTTPSNKNSKTNYDKKKNSNPKYHPSKNTQFKYSQSKKHQENLNENRSKSKDNKIILGETIAVSERLFRIININNLEVTVEPLPNYSDNSDNSQLSSDEYTVIRSSPTSVTLKRHRLFCNSGSSDKENDFDDIVPSPPLKRKKN